MSLLALLVPGVRMGGGGASPGNVSRVFITDTYDHTAGLTGSGRGATASGSLGRPSITGSSGASGVTGASGDVSIGGSYDG